MKLLLPLLLLGTPAMALANDVALTSTVFIEKDVTDAQGRKAVVLEEPKVVTPGDRLVFLLNYRNTGARPAADFVVTNPMPPAVAYQGTPDGAAEVSTDGGRNWGRLETLKIIEPNGTVRGARPEDVTHVRWSMKQAIPSGTAGKLSFRGVVR